jgi:septal ring factor EnvC (AmiA/AmiB activator)
MNSDAERNIRHFLHRLEYGAEEMTRSVLLDLFLAEEEMLGLTEEQLRRIDRHIAKLRQLISEQTKRIERLASFGIDTEARRLVLATLNDLLAAYQVHRKRITAALVGKAEQ